MQIDTDVLEVLSRAQFPHSNTLTLPAALDRKLYLKTAKVLDALGAPWGRRVKAHEFPTGVSARESVDNVILAGTITIPKDEFDLFETPEALAERLAAQLDVKRHHRVLEPSAGPGRLVRALLTYKPAHLTRVDVQPMPSILFETLATDVRTIVGDFLQQAPEPRGKFHRILMNPPFSKRADIAHVRHAYDAFLTDGGMLIAIMSAGVKYRSDRLTTEFRALVEACDGSIEDLPAGSFKAAGTGVHTVVVTMYK